MPAPPDLSVITATCRRPKHLALCIAQFRQQSLGNLRVEQVIVSDGPDPFARHLATDAGARHLELDPPQGQWGAGAKDAGIAAATGRYVCFWDDDNRYEPHALAVLYAAAVGHDIGVVRIHALRRTRPGRVTLPRQWDGTFRLGDIDTMNFCVRRELALSARWADGDLRSGEDFRWIRRLQEAGATLRYVPIVIGEHL